MEILIKTSSLNSSLKSAKIGTNIFSGSVVIPTNQSSAVDIPFSQNIYSSDLTDFLIVTFLSASLSAQPQTWIIPRSNFGSSIIMVSVTDGAAPSRLRWIYDQDEMFNKMSLRNYTSDDITINRIEWYHST